MTNDLQSGASLGSYVIVGRLGTGGMGEVYRARDPKLQRDVAVKVLRPEFADHPDRLARFEREARVLAALNHPRIASIYGLEESAGTPALIMELVEGPTLADRLLGGALPVEEALGIARQIADALEYAHEQGIVHRDLKPANVKVAAEDSVKVLDFGLAKALGQDSAESQPSNSPTVTMPTQAGVVLGTAAYMAPEQAKGRPVDRRADIWAFGCVLYEMLAGAPAFPGETVTDILAAVVREEPDWSRLPAGTPVRCLDLLRRCLTKDLRQRTQAIGDARIALEEIIAGGPAPASPVPSSPWQRWVWPAVAGAAVVAAAALVLGRRPAPAAPARPVTRFTVTLPAGQYLAQLGYPAIALSPDGSRLAYVATTADSATPRVFIRAMDQLDGQPVRGTEGGGAPFFSPDGQWLGFFANGKLMKVPVGGGDAQVVAEAVNSFGASWGPSGILFVPYGAVLQRVSDGGGPAGAVSAFRPGDTLQMWPQWLPDGVSAVFTSVSTSGQSITLQSPGAGERRDLVRGPAVNMPRYAPPGYLLYATGGDLMAVPFDPRRSDATSDVPAVAVVKGVYEMAGGAAQYSVSASGDLAYVTGTPAPMRQRLVFVNRNGVAALLPAAPGHYNQPRLSPDGSRVAVDAVEAVGRMQVWLYDIARDTLKPFTFDGVNRHAVWTPDSKRLVFMSQQGGTTRILSRTADGTGAPDVLTADSPATASLLKIPYSVENDTLTYAILRPGGNAQVWATGLGPGAARAARQVMDVATADGGPQLSPDGRWLAYASDESGRGRDIYVRAFPGQGGPWQISVDGGNEPQWSPRGDELFYRIGNRMMAVPVDTRSGFAGGRPHELFKGDYVTTFGGYVRPNYDVSADGQRFLMLQPVDREEAPPSTITVVLNWSEELKRLVPVKPK